MRLVRAQTFVLPIRLLCTRASEALLQKLLHELM